MEILLALIFGAAVGAAAHFLLAGRPLRGAALAPILGAVVGGIVWLAFTWAGVTTTSPWIWLAALAAPLLIVPGALIILTSRRTGHDARERVRLKIS